MDDAKIVTEYRDTVFLIHTIRNQANWNHRHGLPTVRMIRQAEELQRDLIRFEEILDSIQDRRTRNAVNACFALGMSEPEISILLNIHPGSVGRILNSFLRSLRRDHEHHRPGGGVNTVLHQKG